MEFDIAKANTIITPLWAAPILEVEGNTIAVAGEKDGKKVAVFSFDIHNTDLPLQKEFPILIYQLQNWFFPQGGQILQTVQSGDAMEISLLPETKEAWIVLPDGNKNRLPLLFHHHFLQLLKKQVFIQWYKKMTQNRKQKQHLLSMLKRQESLI